MRTFFTHLFGTPQTVIPEAPPHVVRTIYVCAKEVDERVGEVAHPAELLRDAPFRAVVE